MKQRNPRWGCPRIAEQIALVFGTSINKDVVRRISGSALPTFCRRRRSLVAHLPGHVKDSLHSIDLFRCESVVLRTYWVLVVMDQCIRLVGFGIHAGTVDGLTLLPACSTGRFEDNQLRNISVRITIRFIDFINAKPAFGCSASLKLRQFRMRPYCRLRFHTAPPRLQSWIVCCFCKYDRLRAFFLGKSVGGGSNKQSPLSL
jgi:hypothetical protein